jgi:hypothetical protein
MTVEILCILGFQHINFWNGESGLKRSMQGDACQKWTHVVCGFYRTQAIYEYAFLSLSPEFYFSTDYESSS